MTPAPIHALMMKGRSVVRKAVSLMSGQNGKAIAVKTSPVSGL